MAKQPPAASQKKSVAAGGFADLRPPFAVEVCLGQKLRRPRARGTGSGRRGPEGVGWPLGGDLFGHFTPGFVRVAFLRGLNDGICCSVSSV